MTTEVTKNKNLSRTLGVRNAESKNLTERMLPFKDNYRTGKNNLLCRACRQTTETQSHALEECGTVHTEPETRVEKWELFQEKSTELKKVAKRIDNILKTLEGLTP